MNFKCAYDKLVEIDQLIENPRNPNNHPEKQIQMLAKIINYQGQRSPVVVSNRSGFIVKGHGRLAALKALGWTQVAVDYQDYENEAEEFADMVADNKIAELAQHDDNLMVQGIRDFGINDFELLGLDDFSFLDLGEASYEQLDEKTEPEPKYKIEVSFKNDMDMNQIKDDLVSQGYIVRVL